MEIEKGIRDSIEHVMVGIVISVISNAFIATGLISSSYTFYFGLLNAALVAGLIVTLPKMGFIYLVGWLIGIGLLVQGGLLGTGLIGTSELIIDLGIPIGAIGLKIYLWWKSG